MEGNGRSGGRWAIMLVVMLALDPCSKPSPQLPSSAAAQLTIEGVRRAAAIRRTGALPRLPFWKPSLTSL